MNLTVSLNIVKKAIVTFLHRFHVMIFVVVVLMGLILIVYILYTTVLSSTDTKGYTPAPANTTFDQETIKRINELKTREQSGDDLDFSQGRTNPFVE